MRLEVIENCQLLDYTAPKSTLLHTILCPVDTQLLSGHKTELFSILLILSPLK